MSVGNNKTIEKKLTSWGNPMAPLLPKSLTNIWGFEPIPEWVAKQLGLKAGATIADLTDQVWETGHPGISKQVRSYLVNLVAGRLDQIRQLSVFCDTWPEQLAPECLPIEVRTRNCLDRAGLLHSPIDAGKITYGQLLNVQGMGVISILDFAGTAEAAINLLHDKTHAPAPRSNTSAIDHILEIIDQPWAVQISEQDPRFVDVLSVGEGTLFERLDALTDDSLDDDYGLIEISETLPSVWQRVREIESCSLDSALRQFLKAVTSFSDKRFDALLSRFGWTGDAPCTLEEAGNLAGVTRERIRQLQQRVLKKVPEHAVYLPALDRALETLKQHAPLTREEAANLIFKQGISSRPFDPVSILETATLFHRAPHVRIENWRGHLRIMSESVPKDADRLISIAYRQANASGATNIEEVFAEADAHGLTTNETELKSLLSSFSDVEFLDADWFWCPKGHTDRNRLRNIVRKMLCIANPLHVTTLRDGLRRAYKWRGESGPRAWPLVVPPRNVLRAFFRAHPEFRVDEEDRVNPATTLDYRAELGPTEVVLVDVLRSSPTLVLDRSSYCKGCRERGLNENTFSVYLTYSAIVAHLGKDVWSLRGIQADPAAVESLRAANVGRRREKRVLEYGWTSGGQIWVAVRLPHQISSFVFGIPSGLVRYVADRQFIAVTSRGVQCGSIRIAEGGSSWGYTSFLKRSGADEDDILVATFDLTNGQVVLKLEDDDILDDLNGESNGGCSGG